MVQRLSLLSRNNAVLYSNQQNLARVAQLQRQLASGKRIETMSDDPNAARRALIFRVERFEAQSYIDNIERSLAFTEATDAAFAQMADILDQVKGFAIEGATATLDDDARAALATSVDGALGRLVDLGNTVHDGRFVFSGTDVLTQPFALSADGQRVEYSGNLDDFTVNIGPSAKATVNQDGHTLFKKQVDIFDALIELREALRANEPDRVRELIEPLDTAHGHVNNLGGALGGRVQRLELARDTLQEADVRLGELVSREVDVDLAETAMNLQASQVALEAGLQAGARVLQPTLLDYL